MGSYIYKTKPSHIALARVRYAGDPATDETVPVALYQYAYKPYCSWGSDALNARMHFRSGAAACEAAYRRSDRDVPALGVYIDGACRLYAESPRPFLTRGNVTIVDDDAQYPEGVNIIAWERLPKGVTVQRAPDPDPDEQGEPDPESRAGYALAGYATRT